MKLFKTLIIKLLLIILFVLTAFVSEVKKNGSICGKYVHRFFYVVKNNVSEKADLYAMNLVDLDAVYLKSQLDSDEKTLAFWINIYNTPWNIFSRKILLNSMIEELFSKLNRSQ